MNSAFDYNLYFGNALQQIKHIRAPHAKQADVDDFNWNIVKQQELFDFGDSNFYKHANVVSHARNISLRCLYQIIMQLSKEYGVHFDVIPVIPETDKRLNVRFTLKDTKAKELLFFCEIAECNLWKDKTGETPEMEKFIEEQGASGCKYIYLMFDYAYLQIIGHNNDESDPGRGHNFYAIKCFFENYFGIEEYNQFKDSLKQYVQEVKAYLGYSTVKSLTPSALVNFRKITEKEMLRFPYHQLISIKLYDKKNRKFCLDETEYKKIQQQFIDSKTYLVMFGEKDFAESLITAEWLYDSMKKAQAVDLTAIGMGYFKAMEQLLFELVCLHKNENRTMRKAFSRKDLPVEVELNDANIEENAIDTSIGSIAVFYKNNPDMLRTDLHHSTKEYVKEKIFKYANLRNGYMHKHNICAWDKIDQIRSETFNMMFLLLGSQLLLETDLQMLGKPDDDIFTDYYRLCEYVNYHSGELFFAVFEDGKEDVFIALNDPNMTTSEKKYIAYSGIYMKDLAPAGRKYRITETSLPEEIYLGKMDFGNGEMIDFKPVKVKKVFENHKFIGPNIANDDEFDY